MTCNCIEEMAGKLRERNSELKVSYAFGTIDRPGYVFPSISVKRIDKRNRDKVSVVPTFCLFCGMKYRPVPTE